MKHVLITGQNGYIASALLNDLQGNPDQYQVDAISLRATTWALETFSQYDSIVHCAGLAHIRETKANERLYYEVNRDLPIAVAQKAKAEGVGQFIFISSLSIYGMDEGVITPETELRPKSAYGKSKLEAECGLQAMETEGFRVAILRPPMVYGAGCKGNYRAIENLARVLPVVPDYVNQRSAVSIARLCEAIKQTIDNNAHGIFVPQDADYFCTCNKIRELATKSGRNIPATKLLNFAPALLRRFTGKGRKAFGNLVYRE